MNHSFTPKTIQIRVFDYQLNHARDHEVAALVLCDWAIHHATDGNLGDQSITLVPCGGNFTTVCTAKDNLALAKDIVQALADIPTSLEPAPEESQPDREVVSLRPDQPMRLAMAKALLAFDADLLEAAGLHKERLRKLIQDAEAEPADPIRADLYFADASAPMPGGEHVHAR